MCLVDPDKEDIPSGIERAQLQLAGLGEKQISIINLYGNADDFHNELMMEYPKLESSRGYELLCQGTGKQLDEIPSPRGGYTAKFLKMVAHNAKINICPIQQSLDMTFTLSNVNFILY